MNGPTITMAPTMANPEAFDSVPELREELHRANGQILKLSEQLHRLTCVTQDVSECLARLVVAHMEGRGDVVARELDTIVARHVVVTGKPKGGMH
jgi:hypothetical protein